MKTTLELVHDLQALLSGPEKWSKGNAAKDAYGLPSGINDPNTCSWCFFGAVSKVTEGNVDALWPLAKQAMEYDSPITYNDLPERTFADIRSVLTRMEALASQS